MHRALACVLGDLDLIRPLGRAGIRCAVVAPSGSVNTKSRFARAVIPWGEEEIADGGADLLDALMRFAASARYAPVLYYEEDEQLLFVSRHRETLARAFRFVIAEPGLVEDLVDKARFMQLAERLRLPVPATRHVRPGTGCGVPDIDLRFPLIAKPLRRRRSWYEHGYTTKALQIASQSDLRQWWPRWAQQGIELLLQELIPGPETCIESYHVYVDQRGEIASEFTGRKIRTLPTELGHSTALAITDAVDVAAVGRALVEALGLRGVAKLDFKRDPAGRLHLLEINPRFTLWCHPGAIAGVNLPELVYRDLLGLPRPASLPRARAGVRWCRLGPDWRAAKASGIRFPVWLVWALGCEASPIVWSDPMPFLHSVWDYVKQRS
jgi:D-aspartate ligase